MPLARSMVYVEKVAVVGAGAMGAAIAEVFALNGKQVVLKDVKDEFVQRGLKNIESSLSGLVQFHQGKGDREIERIETDNGIKLTDEQKAKIREAKSATYTQDRAARVLKSIKGTTSYDDLADVDFVVEAVVERMDIKKAVFADLEKHTPRHAILATNTSALSITEIASAVKDRRQKVLGAHFFNPPTTLPLVEVIPALETSESVVEETISFLEELRNHRYPMLPVKVKETPGFVVNRILGRAFTEAFNIYEEGIASARDIDKAMKTGAGWPMGPLELADMVGLDVVWHVAKNMREMGVSESQRTPQIVQQLVASGRLGRKTGKGFYDYSEG
ncbi:MAG: 3-hydroxybutyryl-CoA dehydrogenase [Thermoplasmata archaeon]|nr:3-hydroxybutyryl-CoA dehydrogenase [Thermoplasmata archaeon]